MEHGDSGQSALEGLAQRCLDEARRLGADACEALASDEHGLSVSVRMGEVETVEYQRDRGIAVNVYFGRRKGSAHTADLGPDAVRRTVEAACRIARHTAEDPCTGLADPDLLLEGALPELDLDHPWALEPDHAIELALEVEGAARSHDARIVNSEGASVSSHRSTRVYANSHGFSGAVTGTDHHHDCVVIAGEGGEMQRDHWYTVARAQEELEAPASVGRRAAERALRRLGSRRLSTRTVPVLFAPEVARGLFGHLLAAMSGAAQYRRASFLLDRLGERVLPASVTLQERPHLRRGPASRAFDDEGVATHERALVEDGVPTTWLLDSYSARRLGMRSTGHAGGWSNVIVSGDGDATAQLERLDTGLLVTELIGQGVNLVSGDYSRGAAGFWVERGEVVHPVEEVTIAGNLRDMLSGIVSVGADRDPRHRLQAGSTLVERMAVGGE